MIFCEEAANRLQCRFTDDGCQSQAYAIIHVPEGCRCWPDPVHVVCRQHWMTVESQGPISVVAYLHGDPGSGGTWTLPNPKKGT